MRITIAEMREQLQKAVHGLSPAAGQRAVAIAGLKPIVSRDGRPIIPLAQVERAALRLLAGTFAGMVGQRLLNAEAAGKRGWEQPAGPEASAMEADLKQRLVLNMAHGDWIDVGAIAAIMWNRQQVATEPKEGEG